MTESDSTNTEYPPLNDVVVAHVKECPICQINLTKSPIANVNPGRVVCSDLLQIFQIYADYEGRVNNVVDHDENGTQASGDFKWV